MHAPLGLDAAFVYAKIVPAVSHAVHMPTHIFIQHGMWNEVAHQNVRAFNIAKALFQPGDTPGDLSHSGDWGQYGFLQLGDYAGARERIGAFEELLKTTKHPRAVGTLALVNARYIIETEEWKVQPVADGASAETILANGMSAVKTGDLATAEKMAALLTAKAGGPPAAGGGGAHADHGAAPAPAAGGENPDAGKGDRVMAMELAALVAEAKGQKDQAIAMLTEAVKIEESMRPPRGAADPVKPSHEVLGEVLLRAGKAKEAAAAFDASLLRDAEPRARADGRSPGARRRRQRRGCGGASQDADEFLEGEGAGGADGDRGASPLGSGRRWRAGWSAGCASPRSPAFCPGARPPPSSPSSSTTPGSRRSEPSTSS